MLLLTDIFTKFRETSIKHYCFDSAYYVLVPALSWNAMLKITGVEIELFTEMSMHDFVEKVKRGGIVMAVHRYFKANNPRMEDDTTHPNLLHGSHMSMQIIFMDGLCLNFYQ